MPPRLLVQRFWRHVKAIGPDNGRRLWVDADLGEVAGIAKRIEDPGPLPRREIDVADCPVVEEQRNR
jgi:hypothetical protein